MDSSEKTLIQQIAEKSKEISTETLSMSIGEIINMYKDGDLDIHPEFQRFYRWNISQKSKFIESILLNIPIPAVFVSQKDDGIWDVVDGLQRISTILEFAGEYRNEGGEKLPGLKLQGTKMLPQLENVCYEDDVEGGDCIEPEIKRYFKRAKLLFIVIRRESDSTGKYEIFQRLNTGGSSLSDQEVRNCMMVMENADRFEVINKTSEYANFQNTLRISEDEQNKRFDLELMIRFMCLRDVSVNDIGKVSNFCEFLDDKIIEILNMDDESFDKEIALFKRTFDAIYSSMGEDAFCKYDVDKEKFKGNFYTGAFEAIALGVGRSMNFESDIRSKAIEMWTGISNGTLKNWKGNSASSRLVKTLDIGERLFNNVQN